MEHRSLPIIRLEVQQMEATILNSLSRHQAAIDEYVQEAVKETCQEANIRQVVSQAVASQLKRTITEEVERYFRYGNGKQAVSSAITKLLDVIGSPPGEPDGGGAP